MGDIEIAPDKGHSYCKRKYRTADMPGNGPERVPERVPVPGRAITLEGVSERADRLRLVSGGAWMGGTVVGIYVIEMQQNPIDSQVSAIIGGELAQIGA